MLCSRWVLPTPGGPTMKRGCRPGRAVRQPRARRGVGEAVGVADDELLKGELGVQAGGLALDEERGAGGRRRWLALRAGRRLPVVSSSRRRRGAPRARRCCRRGRYVPRRRESPHSAAAPRLAPRRGRAGRSDRRRSRPERSGASQMSYADSGTRCRTSACRRVQMGARSGVTAGRSSSLRSRLARLGEEPSAGRCGEATAPAGLKRSR